MKKEAFKKFVNNNPHLINYVRDNKMTWQQFYEIYDLYGENNSIWNTFKKDDNNVTSSSDNVVKTIKDLFGLLKGIDLKKVQNTISSIDKAIDAFKGVTDEKKDIPQYEERPKYKYFED